MTTNQYISVREAAQILGVTEKKVMDLIDEKKLEAYKIANQFLRLKKSEVTDLRNAGQIKSETTQHPYRSGERMRDFLYFNDFYLVSVGVTLILLYVIFST